MLSDRYRNLERHRIRRHCPMASNIDKASTSSPSGSQRNLAWLSIIGFCLFLVTAVVVQAMHPEGLAKAPISAYLRGPGSGWLQAAYYVLATSLIMLGICLSMLPAPDTHKVAGLVLGIAGLSVVLVAWTYTHWPMPGDPSVVVRENIHVKSAFTAFLSVTIAMFIETPLRWEAAARRHMWIFAGMVFLTELASLPGPHYTPNIYGLLEKLAIAGLVLWLAACAATFLMPDVNHDANDH